MAIANKYFEDKPYQAAQVTGIPRTNLVHFTLEVLWVIDYNLYVTEQEY